MEKKLYKSRADVKIDGVCAGFAEYLGLDATVIRVLWILFTMVSGGAGLLVYLACMFVMPRRPFGKTSEGDFSSGTGN